MTKPTLREASKNPPESDGEVKIHHNTKLNGNGKQFKGMFVWQPILNNPTTTGQHDGEKPT